MQNGLLGDKIDMAAATKGLLIGSSSHEDGVEVYGKLDPGLSLSLNFFGGWASTTAKAGGFAQATGVTLNTIATPDLSACALCTLRRWPHRVLRRHVAGCRATVVSLIKWMFPSREFLL